MISIALCEDNPVQREVMSDILEDYKSAHPGVEIATFSSGSELLETIRNNKVGYDIYFLDIVMPGINGMEVATTLRMMGDNGIVIFTTASIEYAVASYDVRAYYYMIKPVDSTKLFKILDNAIATLGKVEDSIIVKSVNGDVRLKFKQIMYVEVNDRALFYHMIDGRECESIKLRGSFKEAITPILANSSFVMCGVSKVVNLKYIDAVDSESILFHDGSLVYISRSAYSEVKQAWKNFHK